MLPHTKPDSNEEHGINQGVDKLRHRHNKKDPSKHTTQHPISKTVKETVSYHPVFFQAYRKSTHMLETDSAKH